MNYFNRLNRMQRLMWTIGIMIVLDIITDQVRILFHLYPESTALSAILGSTTAIFASFYTGVLHDIKEGVTNEQ